ncbi:MAG TPA: cbb3-type cytochrome c oxidase subunit II [Chthoniobacterales bacterium]
MKGLQPLFLGIFGIFAFSWLGLTVIPNLQIGSLNPQTDEDGGDIYPQPLSGMVHRGAEVYAENGCVYCHSQQVRPEYGGADLARKWGTRRSAPRDYIFEPIVFLGKMRMGPDLANVGHRPALQEKGAASPTPAPGAATAASPAGSAAAPAASPSLGASPALAASPSPALSPLPAAGNQPAANVPTAAPSLVENVKALTSEGNPLPYTAAWHHRHLYNPRSITEDSLMPSYRFLYTKRRISGEGSPDALNFAGDADETPATGWEIVPSYDAKCLVAYLMSRDQSHSLKEAKSPIVAAAPPAPEAKK